MKKPMKKLLTILLALLLIVSHTTSVFAEDGDEPDEGPETTTENGEVSLEVGDELDTDVYEFNYLDEETGESTADEDPDFGKKFADDEIVRVSIVLSEPSTVDAGYSADDVADGDEAAVAYRAYLQARQEEIIAAIEAELGKSIDVKWNLTLLVNNISVNVNKSDIPTIRNIAGVDDVFIENTYDIVRDDPDSAITTEYMVGATSAWANGYTGAGSRIAIIDTGTDQDHISFAADAFEYSLAKNAEEKGMSYEEYVESLNLLTVEEIDSKLEQLNGNNTKTSHTILSGEAVYKNSKIPFGYNYVDGNTITDHITQPRDNAGEHGSHVSGIAAANRYVKIDGEFVDAATSIYAVGVAPDAQIITMKVFGVNGGASDSDYFAAIEDALILKADTVNLSLGSAEPGSSFAGSYQAIMDSLVGSGMVVTISAGNSSIWNDSLGYDLYADDVSFDTVGSPGSFFNSLSVASADNIGVIGMPVKFNESVEVFPTPGQGTPVLSSVAGEYDFVYIDAIGNPDDYDAVDAAVSLEGKVVIVNRGSITFVEKGNNAVPYGPKALLIANNQSGTISMALDGVEADFPMASITLSDAQDIKASATSADADGITYYTGTVTISDEMSSKINTALEDAVISSFSSWGAPGSLIMKPEIVAPGGSVYNVFATSRDSQGNPQGGSEAYELMSGTSMAAPQISGLSAVLAQYVRENGIVEKTVFDQRALINSLLMSTARPMKNDGQYISILAQGSGLADVYQATQAGSYIEMGEDASNVANDGKVKAEFGQDASREGVYKYSFKIHNFSDTNFVYELDTDLFTQLIYEDEYGDVLMSTDVRDMDFTVEYEYDKPVIPGHDVNKDGNTDYGDVDAILDYLTGSVEAEVLDLDAGEMDADGKISSYDAYELGLWIKKQTDLDRDQLLVVAGGENEVKVTITLSDSEKEQLNSENAGGAYVEGYTYLTCVTTSDDGAKLDVEHSIPLLGFYGSWTDASMFDRITLIDAYYGTDTYPYLGDPETNYFNIKNAGKTYRFIGNPYAIEDEFPEDRLAISGKATVANIKYSPIRNAATTFGVIFDENGEVLFTSKPKNNVVGAYYHVNDGVWKNNKPMTGAINAKLSDLGLEEGDTITIGFFAVPEYYALFLDKDAKTPSISVSDVLDLYKSGEIGEGAYMGYTMTIDSIAPVIESATMNEEEKTITITASDNSYIAYMALSDVKGNTFYLDTVPEQSEKGEKVTYTFDISELPEDVNGVAAFVADYAGNETANFIRIHEGPIIVRTAVYKLTDTLKAGGEYLIASTNTVGKTKILKSNGTEMYTGSANAVVESTDDGVIYIPVEGIDDTTIWDTQSGIVFENRAGGYLGYNALNNPFAVWSDIGYADNFTYRSPYMILYGSYYMYFQSPDFMFGQRTSRTPIYLYEKTYIEEVVDPENVSSVEVEPANVTLLLGIEGSDSTQLVATVNPFAIDDKTVTWSSSDESIATVDEEGVVQAVSVGTVTITATSNKTPSVSGTATVAVVTNNPLDAAVYANIQHSNGESWIVGIDLNDLSVHDLYQIDTILAGGGRSGDHLWGNDLDDDVWSFDIYNDFAGTYHYGIVPDYKTLDGASLPHMTITDDDGTEYSAAYDILAVSPIGWLELVVESDLSYFDLSEDGMHLEAIAFIGMDEDNWLYYYALDANNVVYLLALYPEITNGELDFGLRYMAMGEFDVLMMGEDETAYSMTYGAYQTGEDGLIVADNTTKAIYYITVNDMDDITTTYIGKLDDCENISTLFNADYDSVEELSTEQVERYRSLMTSAKTMEITGKTSLYEEVPVEPETVPVEEPVVPAEPAAEEPVVEEPVVEPADPEEPVVEEPVVEEPVDEPVPEEPAADEGEAADGSLNAIKGYVPSVDYVSASMTKTAKKVTAEVEAADSVKLTITEKDVATNGLYTITYDPENLEYKSKASNAEFSSFNVNEDKGEIKFAFADLEGVETGEAIAEISFEPKCEDSEVLTKTFERNDKLNLSDSENTNVTGIGHDWADPVWTWSADNSSATGTFICNNDNDHVQVVEATIEYREKASTPYKAGYRYWEATIKFNGKTYKDEKYESLPKGDKVPVPDTGSNDGFFGGGNTSYLIAAGGIVLTILVGAVVTRKRLGKKH